MHANIFIRLGDFPFSFILENRRNVFHETCPINSPHNETSDNISNLFLNFKIFYGRDIFSDNHFYAFPYSFHKDIFLTSKLCSTTIHFLNFCILILFLPLRYTRKILFALSLFSLEKCFIDLK